MLNGEKNQNLGENQSILMVSILPCKRRRFLDASPPDCACISGPYEKNSPPNISCLTSVPSVWRGKIVAAPRDRCLVRASQYLKYSTKCRRSLSSSFDDLALLHFMIGVKWGSRDSL